VSKLGTRQRAWPDCFRIDVSAAGRRFRRTDVADCGQRLGVVIARPLRDEDDWSIEWAGCELCDTQGTFLGPFTREKEARHKAVTDLAWLTSA
jgi:hypothetical protein